MDSRYWSRKPSSYTLSALRGAAREADKSSVLFYSMSRKWRTHEGSAKLRAVSQAKAEAAQQLWALAAGFKMGLRGAS